MRLNYDEISPICGLKTVFVEFDEQTNQKLKVCMKTGYHTYDSWKLGSGECERYEQTLPQIVIDTQFVDSATNQVWYKMITIALGWALYPGGYDGDYFWKVAKLRKAGDDEEYEIGVLIPDENGNNILFTVDDDFADMYPEDEYEEAMFKFNEKVSKFYETTDN